MKIVTKREIGPASVTKFVKKGKALVVAFQFHRKMRNNGS